MSELKKPQHIYFMGICGTAMASLACLFKEQGYLVTGSDENIYPPMSDQLERLEIPILKGYKRDNLNPRPDLVIVGNVISAHFEEVIYMKELGLKYMSLPQALSEYFIKDRSSIMVCGTHGKTTSCSFLISLLRQCEKEFGYLIGGIDKNDKTSFCLPSKKASYFLVEGDEYDTSFFDKKPKFLHYKPYYVILTSIEFDHADIYDNLEQIKDSFKLLLKKINPKGVLVFNAQDDHVCELVSLSSCERQVSYGISKGDYQIRNLKDESELTSFDVIYKGEKLTTLSLQLFGIHNALNALGTFALGHFLGWNVSDLKQALKNSQGPKRRQDILGEPQGITVMEDFAHHPTAVNLTLTSLRKKYPKKKIFCVFEPRSATSRRKIFQDDYVNAFDKKADEILIYKAFNQEKIPKENRFSSKQLVEDLKKRGNRSSFFSNTKDIIDFLCKKAAPSDLILLMSNGGFSGLYQNLLKALDKK